MLGFALAFCAPLGWAIATLIDKYVLEHRVRNIWSYTALTGVVTVAFSTFLALFLDWHGITLRELLAPTIAGALTAIFIYSWLFFLRDEDASSTVGFLFLYPPLMAVVAFLVLGERIPLIGYAGMAVTLLGVVLLTRRQLQIRPGTKWWLIGIGIGALTAWGIFVKIAVTSMPVLNAYAISAFMEGLVLFSALAHPDARRWFLREVPITHWAACSEAFNWLGYVASFFALSVLPETIVFSIAGITPVIVLLGERIIDATAGRIVKDRLLLPKLVPIAFIALGIALLGLAGYG